MPQVLLEGYKKLPVLATSETCSGKVYIVTGANSGLGLETARHLVRCSAARVILAVRNITAGEKAKANIERSTGRTGVTEVWLLDLSSYASVQAFAKRVAAELERIDAVVENAGVYLDNWELSEGMETSLTVNVMSTMLLGMLLLPKLTESARRYGIKPRLVFLVSALGFTTEKELAKSSAVPIFSGLNDATRADMDLRYVATCCLLFSDKTHAKCRYALTKLVEMYAVREFAAQFPVEKTGVIINQVAPGYCSTGLGRDTGTRTKIFMAVTRPVLARTAEEGSRTILHGIVADEDSHGKFLSGCKTKELVAFSPGKPMAVC